ncbi:MAG: HepT-like ribonuclease domain-containing protein [Aggregatilineales bacterium]
MNERDETLLHDMLDMALKAQEFLGQQGQEALMHNEMLAFALVRAIEVIGEAASRITAETRSSLPQIPWKVIVGMRNKVIHNYRAIDTRIVWQTVVEDLPPLIAELKKLFPPKEAVSDEG